MISKTGNAIFRYIACAIVVALLGIGSRLFHTGFPLLDKYAGDALYAALIYLILRMLRPKHSDWMHLIAAGLIVLSIELFQLTGIALDWRRNGNAFQKLFSVALGTKFGFPDLLAYAIGISGIHAIDRIWLSGRIDDSEN